MSIREDKVRANLVIEKVLKKELEKIAAKENRSFNNLIVTVLKKLVDEYKK